MCKSGCSHKVPCERHISGPCGGTTWLEQLHGGSLHEFVVKRNSGRGFFEEDIRSIALQLFRTAAFLHGLGWTHTDFKHKNIMLVSANCRELVWSESPVGEEAGESKKAKNSCWPEQVLLSTTTSNKSSWKTKPYYRPLSVAVKVIDFGNVTHSSEYHTKPINTRQFRAPEILLGFGSSAPSYFPPWDEKSDIWCLACVLLFLYTGQLNFNSHDDLEQLVMMELCLGRVFGADLCARARGKQRRLVSSSSSRMNTVNSTWSERPEGTGLSSCLSREKLGAGRLQELEKWSRSLSEQILPEHSELREFLRVLFEFDPALRPSAARALEHVYLK